MSEANLPSHDSEYPMDAPTMSDSTAGSNEKENDVRPSDGTHSGMGDRVVSEQTDAEDVNPAGSEHAIQYEEADEAEAWQVVDFPDAVCIGDIERQSQGVQQALDEADGDEPMGPGSGPFSMQPPEDVPVSPAASPSSAWMDTGKERETAAAPDSPTRVELIDLVRDLNQCNDGLLFRIADLEAALEQTQAGLQEEIRRSQELVEALNQKEQELTTADTQIAHLQNELEFANQEPKRQQIRIETLTAELDSSHHQIAQLEHQCAQQQQQHDEQVHFRSKAEATCQDLQVRLQRQQRYTLQFKAALEKSLDVPPPTYELVAEGSDRSAAHGAESDAPDAQQLVPKVDRIQPWSAQFHTMQLNPDLPNLSEAPAAGVVSSPQGIADQPAWAGAEPPTPDLQAKILALLSQQDAAGAPVQTPQSQTSDSPPDPVSQQPSQATPSLPEQDLWEDSEASDLPTVHPSSLNFAGVGATRSGAINIPLSRNPQPALSYDLGKKDRSVKRAAKDGEQTFEGQRQSSASPQPANAQTAEPEGELWQDLARLIDQPTSEMGKESPEDFATAATADEPLPSARDLLRRLPLGATPSPEGLQQSPSPQLSPRQPQQKKRLKSLAAIDLPSFS